MHAPRSSLLFVISLLLCLDGPAQGKSAQKSLQAAMAAGEVHAFTSNGTSSGDSIILTVTKTQKAPSKTLLLSFSPGLRLTNANKTAQNMVLASIRGRLAGENSLTPEGSVKLELETP